jgi:quinol monooxygenase YgiN
MVGLFLRLIAKPGKEEDVAKFLRDALPLINDEPATTAWFGVRFDQRTFAIFDAFPDDAGRKAHMTGRVADLLRAQWSELLDQPPSIEKWDGLATKLPG